MSWKNSNAGSAFNRVSFLTLQIALGLALAAAGPAFAEDAGAGGGGGPTFSGNVSWYGTGFQGRKTASGEPFDMKKFTAAHRKLSFGTKILIENPRNGKSVIVKVNDRGPYAKGRVLDLSRGAAEKIGILLGGVAFVDCTVLGKDAAKTGSMNAVPVISEVDDSGDSVSVVVRRATTCDAMIAASGTGTHV